MILKGNTHTHSRRSDGKYSIKDVIKTYQKLGYDFLFLTDHNSPYRYKVENYKDMIVFYGNEASNADDIQQHATRIKAKNETLKIINHPIRYKNTPEEVDRMAKENGYSGVEVTQHGKLYPKYFKCSIAHIASDDSHNMRMIADAYILVEVGKKKPVLILKAIKEGKVKLGGPEFDRGFVKSRSPKASGIR